MFIIPCKFDKNKPVIYECIQNIRKFHNEQIVIVDSKSDNKDYFDIRLKYQNIIIEDIENTNYVEGALWHVFNKFDWPHYCLLHDSAMIQKNLDKYKINGVTSIGYFTDSWCDPENIRIPWAKNIMGKTKLQFMMSGWFGVWGSMFLASKKVLDEVKNKKGNLILPTTKYELEAMERIWGIIFEQLGYNIVQNSMNGYVENPLEYVIIKKHLLRQ